MWIESLPSGGLRMVDRVKIAGKMRRVSVPLEKDTPQARRRALDALQKKITEKDLEGIPLLLTSHNCSFRHMLLEDLAEDHFDTKLGDIKRSLPYFNEDTSISDIFDAMLKQKSQIALVIDEYGCFQGIITLEDIIETIFGFEIIDENDVITDMQQYARERWQKRQKRISKHVNITTSSSETMADNAPE